MTEIGVRSTTLCPSPLIVPWVPDISHAIAREARITNSAQ
ncbi:hypothetical protein BURPS668_A0091 [Burkholderia pseudomallei 668]|nr:hypothetical protein BURPS668_A0091 [Burkholderia pseudomallei 668]